MRKETLELIITIVITIDTIEIQRILRDHHEQLYTNKLYNLEETEKFLETHNWPRLNQEEIANLNRTDNITMENPQSVWRSLKKLKAELPHDSAIPLLRTYPKITKTLN